MRPLSRRSNTIPVPVVLSPAQSFDGADGNWSTYVVNVGTPPQRFKVLPGTQVSETWVVLPEGCLSTDPSNCETLRGGQPFNGQPAAGFLTNASSTWQEAGLYNIQLEANLGIDGVAGLFGDDTVGVNNGNGSANGVSLAGQPVAGIAAKSFFLGYLGLGITRPSFSSAANAQNTFLTNLWMDNLIPSLSYGYTAGASYGDSMSALTS
jgi:Eukaryotic aspartyl protease